MRSILCEDQVVKQTDAVNYVIYVVHLNRVTCKPTHGALLRTIILPDRPKFAIFLRSLYHISAINICGFYK